LFSIGKPGLLLTTLLIILRYFANVSWLQENCILVIDNIMY